MKLTDSMRRLIQSRLEKYTRKDDSGCWIWTSSLSSKGYGKFQIANTHWRAHRAAYHVYVAEITDPTMLVLHSCDNPSCVNPAHLSLGSNQDNMTEKKDRGRAASGERHGMAKLTDAQAEEILKEALQGDKSMRRIASDHGVSLGCVGNIKYRNNHVRAK